MSHPPEVHPPYHDGDGEYDADAHLEDDDGFSSTTTGSGGAASVLPSELSEEEEEDDSCPLCMEPFDATDREFHPCKCGYKICLWCWHNLNNIYTTTTHNANNTTTAASSTSTSTSPTPSSSNSPLSSSSLTSSLSSASAERPPLAGRCPACRQPYVYPDRLFNADTLHSSLTAKQRRRTDKADKPLQRRPTKDPEQRTLQQQQLRVLQRNLMYVINLPPSIAKEETLQERRYFGKFGKLAKVKVAATRKAHNPSNSTAKAATSAAPSTVYSAYVTFKKASDCATAISLCHHTSLMGHILKATYGTTKYCAFYTRGVPCTMVKCSYLHEAAKPEDVVGKEELAAMERHREHEKPTPFPLQLTVAEAVAAAKSLRALQPAEEEAQEGRPSPAVPTLGSHAPPPTSVWGSRSTQPASTLFPASSTPTSASASSSTASASTAPSSSSSLRPYVSILAQSQTATQSSAAAAQPSIAPVPASNEIIRIIPAFLKDKFAASAAASASTPSLPASSASFTTAANRRRGASGSATAAPPALSPVSSAPSMTTSPSMSRSTSKASSSSTSSRTSSPHNSPLLQPAEPSTPSAPSPVPPQSPHPPLLEPAALPLPSLPSSPPVTSSSAEAAPSVTSASSSPVSVFPAPPLPPPLIAGGQRPPAEEDFDFLLYSLSDFTPFFRSYAAEDPHFSWLCTLPHTRQFPFRPQRMAPPTAEAPGSSVEARQDAGGGEQAKGGEAGGVDVTERGDGRKEREMEWDEQKQAMRGAEVAAPPAATIAVRAAHPRAR